MMGYAERYQKERYRKWLERVRDKRFHNIVPDAARYVARLHQRGSEPVTVVLSRYWTDVAPPDGEPLQPLASEVAMTYREELYRELYSAAEIAPRGRN